MSAVCPACGVAVVPGYAKCPKCHAALPHRRLQTVAGGTVAEDRRFPVIPIAAGVGVLVLIIITAKVCGGDSTPDPAAGSAVPVVAVQPTQRTAPVDRPFERPETPTTPAPPSPNVAAVELERALRGRRLWSTIDLATPRIDVRSAVCDDPAMGPTIDGVVSTLRSAGLTRLRCLAQSGSVVFERDL